MYELVEHRKLTGTVSSITIDNIPQSGKDLLVLFSARSGQAGGNWTDTTLRPNNQTANLQERAFYGTGSSVGNTGLASQITLRVCSNVNTANTFSNYLIHITDYSSSNSPKSFNIEEVTETNATAAWQSIHAGVWNSNDPITSLVFNSEGYNFLQHTSVTVYKINRTQAIGRPKAVGGNITYANGYWVHAFTGSGTFYAQEDLEVDALVVAGGAGSGNYFTGGGGAGGAQAFVSQISKGSHPIVIGAGGAYTTATVANSGSSSSFNSVTSIGGGAGGRWGTGSGAGYSGGSGGGASLNFTAGGAGTSGQGFAGGAGGKLGGNEGTGGGGGAGGAGGNSTNGGIDGGAGGIGVLWNGSYYAGGGGGGAAGSGVKGTGGLGGGGNGNQGSTPPTSGLAGTGGGAGGHASETTLTPGANGGSGVVIIRYRAD